MDTLMRMQSSYDIAKTRKRENQIHVPRHFRVGRHALVRSDIPGNLNGAVEEGPHKAHEEQPPAAARARRFAAKKRPGGAAANQSSICKECPGRTLGRSPPCASLRQRLRLKTAAEVRRQRGLWR